MSSYDLPPRLDHYSHQSPCEVVDSLQAVAEYLPKDKILKSLPFTEPVSNTYHWSKKRQKVERKYQPLMIRISILG